MIEEEYTTNFEKLFICKQEELPAKSWVTHINILQSGSDALRQASNSYGLFYYLSLFNHSENIKAVFYFTVL